MKTFISNDEFFSESEKETNDYISYLKAICSLFKLFTDNKTPIYITVLLRIFFVKRVQCQKILRSDITYNAKINKIGIGLNTFIKKGTN